MAEKVQRDSFGSEKGAGISGNAGDLLALLDAFAIAYENVEVDVVVERPKRRLGYLQARDDAGLARRDSAGRSRAGRNGRHGRDVASLA